MDPGRLLERMVAGDRLALSRMITFVEARRPEHLKIMGLVQERCGRARVVGVTGPPGSGKSTLVDRMIKAFRREGMKVGVIAIDPSSPFSGGAVLGDRIRMQDHAGDDGVFIRSLGSRGSQGGLSRATREVVKLYDAFGMDEILIETVGVGQAELDIMELADTTIVLLTPESGDTIQTMKAGILEIADLLVVNKADREGADRMVAELKGMLELGVRTNWQVPVFAVQADQGIGIALLVAGVEDHEAYLRARPVFRRRDDFGREVREIVFGELARRLPIGRDQDGNVYRAAERILKSWGGSGASIRRRRSSSPRSSRRVTQRLRRR